MWTTDASTQISQSPSKKDTREKLQMGSNTDTETQAEAVKISIEEEGANGFSKHEIMPLVQKKTEIIYMPRESSKNNRRASEEINVLLEYENIVSAYTAFFFSVFHLLWSGAVGYWHLHSGHYQEGIFTGIIIVFGGVVVEIVYLTHKKIKLRDIWNGSKILYILSLVPCLTTIMLSMANTVFTLKESRNKSYQRPWSNTRIIFLTEVLSLAFPQCILQTCILMEDSESIPSNKGFFVFFGIWLSTIGIAFSRIRYDTAKKYEPFGKGIEMWIRFAVVWSNKVLHLITSSCFIITARLAFPDHTIIATVACCVVWQVFIDVQVILSESNRFREYYGNSLGLLFIIPQFASFISLILWVNTDPHIYETYIGCTILGCYFYVELINLLGWLMDSCKERDIEYISIYPHFFGNFVASLCK